MGDGLITTRAGRQFTRRTLLGGFATGAGVIFLAACGTTATPTVPAPTAAAASAAAATTATKPTTAPSASAQPAPAGAQSTATAAPAASAPATMAASAAPAAPTAARPSTTSKGELIIALGFDFPAKIDALKDTHLLPYGMLETLTRQTPDNKLEPWLAEKVSNVDPTTWRVTLRRNAKFWDGSPVTAQDVIAAFKKNWATFPDTKGLISPDTQLTAVDATTLDFKTPSASGFFPYALSLSSFAIHKPSTPGGDDGGVMTGPYKATKLTVGTELLLEPFLEHWSGAPPLAKITLKFVSDPNARILALQSGDVDMLYNFPPESIKNFSGDIVAGTIPSGRVDLINLNFARPLFADRAVREATALGIDRAVLNTVGLDGKGTPATALFPLGMGYETVPLQGTDVARAKTLLDEAGWKVGSDGVRAKDGQRLAFTLFSYPGRAQLTPYAVSIQSQLKPLGYDIQVKEVQAIAEATKDGNWDAAMKSNNMLPTGDPLYEFNRLLVKGGGDNTGGYSNPQLEALLDQLRPELDPAKRQAISKQVQEIVKADVPDLFLVVGPITYAYKKSKLRGYVPHPNDSYLMTTEMSVS